MKKVVIFLLLVLCLFVGLPRVYAGRGCCSHHGGQAYCNNGRWVCRDGTYSPTCTCSGGSSSNTGGSSYRSYTTTTRTTTARKVYGCTNSSAINYNSQANVSDGTCQYEKTEAIKESIYYDTKTQGKLTVGNKKVIQKGQNGEKEIIVKKIVNESGEEISREIISENIITEPVDEIVIYENTTTKPEISNNTENENSSSSPLIVTIILLIVNSIYGRKNKDAKLIINKIKKSNSRIKYILYFLYFVLVIPVFIDIVLVILDFISKRNKSLL